MDIFVEYMVKKKKKATDYLAQLGLVVFGLILIFGIFGILMAIAPQFSSIILLIVVGIGWIDWKLITSFNVEYEYSLVNNEMDVDKIISARKRKRLTSVRIRGLEAFGRCEGREFDSYMRNAGVEKIFACRDKSDSRAVYAVYLENECRKMLVFNPSDRMIGEINKLNPRKMVEI